MQNRECIVFEQTRDTDQRLHEPVDLSSTNYHVDHLHPTRYLSHLPAGILLHAAKKNNNGAP